MKTFLLISHLALDRWPLIIPHLVPSTASDESASGKPWRDKRGPMGPRSLFGVFLSFSLILAFFCISFDLSKALAFGKASS